MGTPESLLGCQPWVFSSSSLSSVTVSCLFTASPFDGATPQYERYSLPPVTDTLPSSQPETCSLKNPYPDTPTPTTILPALSVSLELPGITGSGECAAPPRCDYVDPLPNPSPFSLYSVHWRCVNNWSSENSSPRVAPFLQKGPGFVGSRAFVDPKYGEWHEWHVGWWLAVGDRPSANGKGKGKKRAHIF